MAVEYLAGNARSWNAGADLSAVKYRFVKQHTVADQVVLCQAGDPAVGVVQEGRATGQAWPCCARRRPRRSPPARRFTAGQTVAAGALGVAVPWVAGYSVAGTADSASVTSGIVSVTLETFGGTS